MNNEQNSPQHTDSLGPIEYVSEATESTNNHHYIENEPNASGGYDAPNPYLPVQPEQKALSIFGLILAIPFPVFTILLWVSLNGIKGQAEGFSEGAMNTVVLYLIQFFIIPLLSLTSVIIAFIVTIKSKAIAKKIGYISMGVTGVGLIILGIFLNNS